LRTILPFSPASSPCCKQLWHATVTCMRGRRQGAEGVPGHRYRWHQ
jgi:hypothetical protein